jgi:ribosomal protein S3
MGGWRQQVIYGDVLWIILISIKYYSSSFMSNMISEQIIKRKKQWPFIKVLKITIREVLPKNMINNPARLDGIRISINGKINGRNRSINYLIQKLYKDSQITKFHPIFLKIDYSMSLANSKYGVFGIRV